ncbi:MAG: hypothetical protein PHD97_02235 [Bacteroidales bacterium]|nr:hypothetical protein [Bacteroidales bacterium]
MKKLLKICLGIIVISAMCIGCKKDKNDDPDKGKYVSYENVRTFFSNNGEQSQSFKISAAQTQTITGKKGTKITFMANSFVNASGQAVTGDIDIELKELLDKHDILLSDKPTVSYGRLLETGGVFYIKATQNGQRLKSVNPVKISYNYTNLQNDMQVFSLAYPTDSVPTWTLRNDSSLVTTDSLTYNMWLYPTFPDSIGWINCDRFYNVSPRTNIEVTSNDFPDINNTVIYIYFKTINSIDCIGKDNNNKFISMPVPENYNVTILAVSIKDKLLYYAKQDLTITTNAKVDVTFQVTTEDELKNIIKNL